MVELLTLLPVTISVLFAVAIETVRRRRREAFYGCCWAAAFAAMALGWLLALAELLVARRVPPFGATASLCWLGAALLVVHGLRVRARRGERRLILCAIWIGSAIVLTFVIGTAIAGVSAGGLAVPVVSASGLLLAAAALGPRRRRADGIEWLVAGLLTAAAVAQLLLLTAVVAGLASVGTVAVAFALAGTIGCVALGLGALVVFNADLTVSLQRVARTDPLTGIWNRRGFDEAAPVLVERSRRRSGACAAVAIADIDAFKEVNDRHGHTIGDAVLVGFARALDQAVGEGDFLARLGGEEFALLAVGCDSVALLERVERVRAGICLPNGERVGMPGITVSFGVAEFCTQSWSVRDALERADHALYRAKREGRNRCVLGAAPADDALISGTAAR